MTQILMSELANRGLYNHQFNITVNGFTTNSEEIDRREKSIRDQLNAKIAILENLSKEFKTNPIFQGDAGKENQNNALRLLKFGTSDPSLTRYTAEKFNKNYGIDMREQLESILNSTNETFFPLKSETIERIQKEDFDSYYDNQELIQLTKEAVNPSFKDKIVNLISKFKNKIFGHKQNLLPEGQFTKNTKAIRPKNYDNLSQEQYEKSIEGVIDLQPNPYSVLSPRENPYTNPTPLWELDKAKQKIIRHEQKELAKKYRKNVLERNITPNSKNKEETEWDRN